MKKIVLSVFFALFLSLLAVKPTLAQSSDLIINCPDSDTYATEDSGANCVFQGSGTSLASQPLFAVDNLAPGENLSRSFIVNNLDQDESCDLYLTTTNQVESGQDLAQVLATAIYSSTTTYVGSHIGGIASNDYFLDDLYDAGVVDLGLIAAGNSQSFTWLMALDGASVGNEYQGQRALFDFDVSFTCGDPSLTPTATPSPEPDDGEGDGTDDGGMTAEETCQYPDEFDQAPTGFTAVAGVNSVSLGWDGYPTGQLNQYAIFFYNDAGDEYSVLGQYVGDATGFTISSLSGGTWTFELIAIGGNDNLCISPRASTTAFITGGVVAGGPVAESPEGEVPVEEGEVLGVDTNSDTETESGRDQVQGAMTSCIPSRMRLPWMLLIAQLVLLLVVELRLKRDSSIKKYVYIFGITLVSNIIFYLLKDCSCFADGSWLSFLCRWYWLVSIVESVLMRLIGYGFIEVVEE